MKITCVSLLLVLLLKGNNPQCLTENDSVKTQQNAVTKLLTGRREFSLVVLPVINQLKTNENIFVSPSSIHQALLLIYFLVGAQTEDYLKRILKLDTSLGKIDLFPVYKLEKLLTRLEKNNNSSEFTNANKVFVADQFNLKDCMRTLFNDEISTAPLHTDPQGAKIIINNWMDTQNIIKLFLPLSSIDQNSDLISVDLAYFRGKWKNKFNPEKTKRDTFYINPSERTLVDMMQVEGTFHHGISQILEAHILEMPFEGGEISTYVFLPPFVKPDGLSNTLNKLEKFPDIINNSHLTPKRVHVLFPKFSLEHTEKLIPVLRSLGANSHLETGANFSTLSVMTNISQIDAIHKAKIVVNEQGVKAASTPYVYDWRLMYDEDDDATPVEFNCNRPFIFMIFNKKRGIILFTGVYRRPQ